MNSKVILIITKDKYREYRRVKGADSLKLNSRHETEIRHENGAAIIPYPPLEGADFERN